MILVGYSFDYKTMSKHGLCQDIDGDRKACAITDANGGILLIVTNGTREVKLALTREAAEAVALVLADTLTETYKSEPPDDREVRRGG